MTTNYTPPAYAAVPASVPDSDDENELKKDPSYEMTTPTAVVNLEDLYLDKPVRSVRHPIYANLKEAKDVTWTDDFFDDDDKYYGDDSASPYDEDVIAVFDFDYEAMEKYYTNVGWASFAASFLIFKPLFVLALAGGFPCLLRKNVQWSSRSQHVAVTRDGIRFVRDRRPACWGLSCTDQGKSSKTVPFDMITDCDVQEPAGNTCLCVPKILSVVTIDTASSGVGGGGEARMSELKLAGLKDPYGFKKLVWAMKRSQRGTDQTKSNHDNGQVAELLTEIRNELRANNELLMAERTKFVNAHATQAEPISDANDDN